MISIIVPIYNAESYLDNCIKSVLNQEYTDWKLILVNDGSFDSSLSICERYAALNSNIYVLSQDNKGQAAARNLGLSYVQTPYVTFLDADDSISSDTLNNMLYLLGHPEVDCLQYPLFRDYSTERAYLVKFNPEIIDSDFYFKWLSEKKISWIVCNKIFKTCLFNSIRFTEGIIYEDNLLVAQMLKYINVFYITDIGVYYYYQREDSTTTSILSEKKEQDSFFVTRSIYEILTHQKQKVLALVFLSRIVNIHKSLKSNFGRYDNMDDIDFSCFSIMYIMSSNLSSKDKVKIILAKVGIY